MVAIMSASLRSQPISDALAEYDLFVLVQRQGVSRFGSLRPERENGFA